MTVAIEKIEKVSTIMECLRLNEGNEFQLRKFLLVSNESFCGKIGNQIACVWGLVTPTLLSNQAYLWLWHNEVVEGHQFIFIRHSQRVMEVMLNQYPVIEGHVKPDNEKSKRWLRWLGAKFGGMDGNLLTFRISRNG